MFFNVSESFRSTAARHRGHWKIGISMRAVLPNRELARELEEDMELDSWSPLRAPTPSPASNSCSPLRAPAARSAGFNTRGGNGYWVPQAATVLILKRDSARSHL